MDSLQYCHVSLVLGSPALDAAQEEAAGLLCSKGIWLTQVQLAVHQHHPPVTWSLHISMAFSSRCLPFAEFHKIPVNPFFQLPEVLLNDSILFWCIRYPSQSCEIYIIAGGTLCPIIYIINKYGKQCCPNIGPLSLSWMADLQLDFLLWWQAFKPSSTASFQFTVH